MMIFGLIISSLSLSLSLSCLSGALFPAQKQVYDNQVPDYHILVSGQDFLSRNKYTIIGPPIIVYLFLGTSFLPPFYSSLGKALKKLLGGFWVAFLSRFKSLKPISEPFCIEIQIVES